jgi:hypothetical protein
MSRSDITSVPSELRYAERLSSRGVYTRTQGYPVGEVEIRSALANAEDLDLCITPSINHVVPNRRRRPARH